ncbi:PAS domain-containing sensor histidine kinase [Winogradskyella sp. J14-2]|uniref:PAS domain-containing sensor histidine kinase n=1 Tax=Winogradskyella sp. J14-2 TaxID=1936080 RepID=UPI000972DBB1|nr:PAS domain-containing sensor histidine kinase [Winogradskyella sp. J14-2]APY08080.1 PAS domain-containing sensor histidine kinase [Winogradskyella sp. J14-2]
MNQHDEIDILKRALARERASRKAAEKILEEKSTELYNLTQKLKTSNTKLEKLVKERTLELKGVFENIIDAYVVMDLWGNVLKMNDAAVHLLGYDKKEEDFNLVTLADQTEIDNVMEAFDLLMSEGAVTNFQVKINTKFGEQKLVQINASIILGPDNKPIAAQGIVRDITKDKQAEEQLIESKNRLSTLIRNLDSGVLLEDENRKIILTNNKFCDLFNIPLKPSQLVGEDCTNSAQQSKDMFSNSEGFVKRINDIVEKKELVIGDELKMLNGNILERDYIPVFSDATYKGHLWRYRDVTLSRKYRHSIEVEREKYRNIIANMNLGLMEVDNNDRILMINQSFAEISGYTEKELIGKQGRKIFTTDKEVQKIKNESKKRLKGESNSYEIKVKIKNGETRYWLISGAPNYDINGKVVGSIGIHLDITDLKSLELQKENLLHKLEKSNDELQEYAHIVSHDLKSPLRSIDALVQWIKEDNENKLDDASLQNLNLIETTLEKMEQLISDVLEYSSIRSEKGQSKPVNTDTMVKDLLKILYIPEHIEVKIHDKLPVLTGEKTKLQQLFQNLISNAVKFIDKPKGKIDIKLKELPYHYQFSISDNGIGIEEKFHNKIFKIFHSLNKSKDSTGVGLSIVKKIVDLHDGKIWLESTPGVGTTFHFTLTK